MENKPFYFPCPVSKFTLIIVAPKRPAPIQIKSHTPTFQIQQKVKKAAQLFYFSWTALNIYCRYDVAPACSPAIKNEKSLINTDKYNGLSNILMCLPESQSRPRLHSFHPGHTGIWHSKKSQHQPHNTGHYGGS